MTTRLTLRQRQQRQARKDRIIFRATQALLALVMGATGFAFCAAIGVVFSALGFDGPMTAAEWQYVTIAGSVIGGMGLILGAMAPFLLVTPPRRR